jgi:hypothetical protein
VARVAAWQYADVPLALFVLLAAGLSALGLQRGQPRAFVAAGVAAGLAAWTKNEGLLHLLCIGAAVALFAGRRAVLLYAGGALPLLALCAAFKLSPYPATNDLFAGSSLQAAVERLSDLSRWSSVAQSFLLQPFSPRRWGFAAWAVAPLFFFRRGWSPAEKLIWTAVALGLAGSFSVYLLTPRTLAWHLETSLDRLYLHVFPAALLAFSAGIARLRAP